MAIWSVRGRYTGQGEMGGCHPAFISVVYTSIDMNTTADQAIQIDLPVYYSRWRLNNIIASNPSAAITTALGGIYTGPGKTGVTIVGAGQTYSGLTTNAAATSGATLPLTPAAGINTLYYFNPGPLYFSLSTPEGSAKTIDLHFILGIMA